MKTRKLHALTAALILGAGVAACDNPADGPEVAPPPDPTAAPEGQGISSGNVGPAPSVPGEQSEYPAMRDGATGAPETRAPSDEATADARPAETGEGQADAGAEKPADDGAEVPVDAQSFVAEAMGSGLAEAEAGRIVAANARNESVRAFAQRLDQDHTAANQKLVDLAGDKDMRVEEAVPPPKREQLTRLEELSGAELDQAFLEHFGTSAHEEAIALYERQAEEGEDEALRTFAKESLPMLREHLTMARELEDLLASGGATAGQ